MNNSSSLTAERKERTFITENFRLEDWDDLKPYFKDLESRTLNSAGELRQWLRDRSELEAFISEDFAWRYISFTRNTADDKIKKRYEDFIRNIQPMLSPESNALDRKMVASEFLAQVDDGKYHNYIRDTRTAIELFREENIPLFTEISEKTKRYAEIIGAMSVEVDGQEYTLPQAAVFLKNPDRDLRKKVYNKVVERRLQDRQELDNLFDELLKLRHQVALNAGFENFRDYKFKELGRFDYSVQDTEDFHESVRTEMVPLYRELVKKRQQELGIDPLKPYDLDVDPQHRPSLKPFENANDLTQNSIEVFAKLNPLMGQVLELMKKKGFLDLESRKNKAPGGYNYPLMETGLPFIFMNSAGTFRDLETMMHEGGHAIHTYVTRDLELAALKNTPSEVAELASMSMELMSMKHWDVFFEEEEDLKRAKREQLEGIVGTLPWIATVDKFQQWIYTNPNHTAEERAEQWVQIYREFSPDVVDWSEHEDGRNYMWHKQLHVFELPFYYIEYGFAQLGAIAVWKNFRENADQALEDYLSALKLGYTKSIPEIYETAGIKFDFSKNYIRELSQFLKKELEKQD